MTDKTDIYRYIRSSIPEFHQGEDQAPKKWSALSQNIHDLEIDLAARVVAFVPGLKDVKVTLVTQYISSKGDPADATELVHGGRVKVVSNGYRPGRSNNATPELQILAAKINDLFALAEDLFTGVVLFRGLTEGNPVSCKDVKCHAHKWWGEPCQEFGVTYKKLAKGVYDDLGRKFGSLEATERTIELFGLTPIKGIRPFLPDGKTWKSELARIVKNRKAKKSAEQWAVECICPHCEKEAAGATPSEKKKNATRKISIDLLNRDPLAGACRHGHTFVVVEGKSGRMVAQLADLREVMERDTAAA